MATCYVDGVKDFGEGAWKGKPKTESRDLGDLCSKLLAALKDAAESFNLFADEDKATPVTWESTSGWTTL